MTTEERLNKVISLLTEYCEIESNRDVNADSCHIWLADQLEQLKEAD